MTADVTQIVGTLVVEQLTTTQWHVIDSIGHWGSGVTNWVAAVDRALWTALLTGRQVESVNLKGERLLLLRSRCSA